MKIIIVGGVAGGASAATRLRRLAEDAEIIVLERGGHISYANCGLPYYIGGEIAEERALTLQTPQSLFRRFHIDVRINQEVVEIDPELKQVSIRKLPEGTLYQESYDKLILSPGAAPVVPALPGVDLDRVFTLRNIPDTLKIHRFIQENQPQSAVVIGGGAIGVEMAENFTRLGIAVTIVEMAEHLIAPLDLDMACTVHHYLQEQGIKLCLKNGLERISPGDTAGPALNIQLNQGEIKADFVVLAVGVRPDTVLADKAGLLLNPKGAIVVNEFLQTSNPDIYAVGDAATVRHFVTGEPTYIPLAGPANKQGRIAADNICGLSRSYLGTQGSSVLRFFDLTVTSTGLNEAALKAAGYHYHRVYILAASHASYYPGATDMRLKLLFEQHSGQILGAQIVGFQGVDKRGDVLAAAIRARQNIFDLTQLELGYAPPFSSAKDPVNMLGFVAENVLTGKVQQYYWEDVPGLPTDGSVICLDVRTAEEYAEGHLAGSMHIPLDELRENLDQLERSKPIYVNCQSGLRSYLACRILSQRGFTCYNLAGGYSLYQSIMQSD